MPHTDYLTMNNDKWNTYVNILGSFIVSKENYQRTLGKLAFEIANEFGPRALYGISEDIAENFGVRVSPSTLRNYRYVYEKIQNLNLPEDISYRSLQAIASSKNPEKWAEKINKEGLSSVEIYHMIREEKGVKQKKQSYICEKCGYKG